MQAKDSPFQVFFDVFKISTLSRFAYGYALDGSECPSYLVWPQRDGQSYILLDTSTADTLVLDQNFFRPLGMQHLPVSQKFRGKFSWRRILGHNHVEVKKKKTEICRCSSRVAFFLLLWSHCIGTMSGATPGRLVVPNNWSITIAPYYHCTAFWYRVSARRMAATFLAKYTASCTVRHFATWGGLHVWHELPSNTQPILSQGGPHIFVEKKITLPEAISQEPTPASEVCNTPTQWDPLGHESPCPLQHTMLAWAHTVLHQLPAKKEDHSAPSHSHFHSLQSHWYHHPTQPFQARGPPHGLPTG